MLKLVGEGGLLLGRADAGIDVDVTSKTKRKPAKIKKYRPKARI